MKINDRLLSFMVEPGDISPTGNRIDISFFKDGHFIVSESPRQMMDDSYNEISSCVIGDKEQYNLISSFLKRAHDEFVDAPTDSLFKGPSVSQYYMQLDGLLFRGSLAETDEKYLRNLRIDDARKARWNNKIVKFTHEWNNLVSNMQIMGYPANKPDELYLISPRSLYLLNRAKSDLGEAYNASSYLSAIKKAAKLAFDGPIFPTGDRRFSMENNLKAKLLRTLNSSKSRAEFDKNFVSLCKETASFDLSCEFCDVARWMDTAYLLLLLREEEIIDERKIAYLHPPVSKNELFYFYGKANITTYKEELSRKRTFSGGYSPIYQYLIDLLDYDEIFNERGPVSSNAS